MRAASPTLSASSTLHPLDSAPSARPSQGPLESSSTSSRAPSPILRGIRSRRPTPTPAASPLLAPPPPHPTTNDYRDDSADVTRPSLRKATKDALGLAGQGSSAFAPDSATRNLERDRARAASEGLPSSDREVVVHKVLKTDTLASVSLQYGITQQALRKANRLWATDPIHLRSTLLIPLDECNLPSSSFGLERVAREENGDITVWRREETPTSRSKRTNREGLHAAAGRSDVEHRVVSPTARRLISTSSFDTSPNPNPTTNDFLAIWDDTPATSSRPSLDSVRSYTSSDSSPAPPKPDFSPRISSYLSSTNNPYSSSSASLELSPPLPPSKRFYDATSAQVAPTPSPLIPVTPEYSSRDSTSSHTTDDTPPSESGSAPGTASTTLSKRTLKVERLPASQLSFFPGPHPSNSHPPVPPPPSSSRPNGHRNGPPGEDSDDLFFGPLANSLAASFPSLRGLNKYLPNAFAPRAYSTGVGQIALPLSRTASPHRDRSTPTQTGSGNGWNLDYFGGEEEHAAAATAVPPSRWQVEGARRGRIAADRKRVTPTRGEVDGTRGRGPSAGGFERRTSEIGLEDVGSVERRAFADSGARSGPLLGSI
ncbi:hypothetical protein JCM11491_001838 [Sporobolomyces phaffii]